MKKKIILILVVLIVGSFFVYTRFKSVDVSVERVTEREFIKEVVLTGNVITPNKSFVKSKISGVIKEVLVADGQEVEKDDILLKVDSSEYYQNYNVIVQDINKAQSAIDEYTDTYRDMLGEPEVIHGMEKLEIALQQAKSRQIASSIGFNNYEIKAPTSGNFYFANSQILYPQEYLVMGTEVGKIYDNNVINVKVGVTPDELSVLENLSNVVTKLEGTTTELKTEMSHISDSMERNENGDEVLYVTFNILDSVDDIYKKDGLDAKVFIRNDAGTMLGVPFSSIFSEKAVDYVYVVKDNKAIKTRINILEDYGDYVSIESEDLKLDDVIVQSLVEGLKNGSRVKFN